MNKIPHIKNQMFFTENVTIEGKVYELEFLWNHRCEYWTVTVRDGAGTDLITGVKVVLGFDIFKRYSKTNIPTGLFIAIRDGASKAKIALDELGNTANIYYLTEAEIESL